MITSFSSFIPDGLSACEKKKKTVTRQHIHRLECLQQQSKEKRAAGTGAAALASQFTVFNVALVKNSHPAVLSLLVFALRLSLQILKFSEN